MAWPPAGYLTLGGPPSPLDMSSCPPRSCIVIPLDELPRDEVDNDDDDEFGITATDEGDELDRVDDSAKLWPFCKTTSGCCSIDVAITFPPLDLRI